ncbi:MAG: regulator [Sedimentitalea sp.]|nr:regulator [Sedimentitalea sp.]
MPEDQRDAEINRRIDENLRKVFQEQVEEDLPDRFKLLLDQLRKQDGDDGEDDQA